MSDMELLKMAAKAVDIEYDDFDEDRGCHIWFLPDFCRYDDWDPLRDDGDAHRLAARLELDVMHRVVGGRRVEVLAAGGPLIRHEYEGNIAAAMRRAIVLAAAEIGSKKTL